MILFPGGTVDARRMPNSHNGSTPTTLAEAPAALAGYDCRDAAEFLKEAQRLIALGRLDEARFELQMAARHVQNAAQWCEPYAPVPTEVSYLETGK